MRRIVLILLVIAAAAGGAYWYFVLRQAAPVQPANGAGRRGGGPGSITPVLVVAAETKDVPIYLDGLGTVQASASVTVKPQVDGKLLEVLFSEGQEVKAGAVLARIDPRSYQAALDQATAKKAQDQANLTNARLDVARYAKLQANAYTSAQQYDTARSTAAQLEAQVAGDQAMIDTARVNLSYTTLTAPIDGRIGIRQVDAGNIVHASDANGICTIATLQPISVQFTLPQQTLRQVTQAMAQGKPEVLALPQDTGGTGAAEVLDRGMLTVLDNTVDATTGTIKLKAEFPNPRLRLWPGAFVNIRLLVETRKAVVTVPPVAVQRGPQGAFVYVLRDDQTVQRRIVRESHEDLFVAVIADGLKAGERVVTDGAARLSDGSKVLVADPAATAPQPPRRQRPPGGATAPGTGRPTP